MEKIVDIAHHYLDKVKDREIAVDFTCGNGNDTGFLASRFAEVHAFDIQEIAIAKAKRLNAGYQNIRYHLDSHLNFDDHLQNFDAGIFNLGYLPGGDKSIATDGKTVIDTLIKALECLNKNGRIVVVLYPGFDEGKQEALMVQAYAMGLESRHYDVGEFKLINRNDAPFIVIFDKH